MTFSYLFWVFFFVHSVLISDYSRETHQNIHIRMAYIYTSIQNSDTLTQWNISVIRFAFQFKWFCDLDLGAIHTWMSNIEKKLRKRQKVSWKFHGKVCWTRAFWWKLTANLQSGFFTFSFHLIYSNLQNNKKKLFSFPHFHIIYGYSFFFLHPLEHWNKNIICLATKTWNKILKDQKKITNEIRGKKGNAKKNIIKMHIFMAFEWGVTARFFLLSNKSNERKYPR